MHQEKNKSATEHAGNHSVWNGLRRQIGENTAWKEPIMHSYSFTYNSWWTFSD